VIPALLLVALMAWPAVALAKAAQDAPRVLLDQSPRAVEYQLGRLSNDQLVRVERRDTDDKYRPVYAAILTRKGMARPFRAEAVAALVKMGGASATRVLLDALAKVAADDTQNAGGLLDLLLEQPADTLRPQREMLAQAGTDATEPAVLRGVYGGLMIADGDPAPAWQAAAKRDGHLVELLRSVSHLGKSVELRAALFTPIAALLAETRNPGIRVAAVEALAWTRRDSGTFDILAREIRPPSPALGVTLNPSKGQGSDAESRAAAISAVQLLPKQVWTPATIEPLARAIVAMVRETPSDRRTEPSTIDALQLGERLAALLPEGPRLDVRRELRALGVQVVRIETVPEQMLFDLKWFAVQAGKPVQIVLANPDTMPHNLVVGQPGSLQEVGTKGGMMPPPSDPDAKAYIPDTPLVLQATRLINGGETERLTFTAPAKPGEYVYLCTFPGHFVRMYGVMLVVPDLEAWEAKPTVPADPLTNKPFTTQK
jgi:azurin